MASAALRKWRNQRQSSLDELESAHRRIGGTGPGRRYATEQINHAYAILLSSQFQGFCRDLHTECVEAIVAQLPANLQPVVREAILQNRKLDAGNPNPGNIASDYNRFGALFWDDVKTFDQRNPGRIYRLEELVFWRNAIAHQDFSSSRIVGIRLVLPRVRSWRNACRHLAASFDEVMRRRIATTIGFSPW